MEKYRLAHERKAEEFLETQTEKFPEVRITQQGKPRNYISYAMNLFESGSTAIVLKAMGRAINKAVTIAEILKRKMPLHQVNDLASVEMIDVYEPVEEGLDIVTSRRYVSCIKITLSVSLHDAQMDTGHLGYQPPLPDDEMHQQQMQQQQNQHQHQHQQHHYQQQQQQQQLHQQLHQHQHQQQLLYHHSSASSPSPHGSNNSPSVEYTTYAVTSGAGRGGAPAPGTQ